ncbi:MAG: hypothetical protein H0W61_12330 [Bacteroidetes bacterium]|nr:hypothetical protein [Bacteroidota bacterium]
MKLFENNKGRTFILVGIFLLLLFCYFNQNYIKEKIRSFSIKKEARWSIERTSVEEKYPDYKEKQVVEVVSPVLTIDQVYHAMTGPAGVFYFKADNTQKSGIIWLTDYSVKVMDADCKAELTNDYLCRNNLDVAFSEFIQQRKETFNNRLIMTSQGQSALHFPKGFALPLLAHDNISITTQALNYDNRSVPVEVRHKVKMEFIRDQDLKTSLKPLFKRTVNVFVEVDTCDVPKTGCDSGRYSRPNATPGPLALKKDTLIPLTGHWKIPIGFDTVKYDITSMLQIPFNTTLHYASVYVYPYCVSLSLKDVTTGEVLFTSAIKNFSGKTGVESIAAYSDVKGKEIFFTHSYQLICVTNNTSNSAQDMMAGMILYFHDKELEHTLAKKSADKKID